MVRSDQVQARTFPVILTAVLLDMILNPCSPVLKFPIASRASKLQSRREYSPITACGIGDAYKGVLRPKNPKFHGVDFLLDCPRGGSEKKHPLNHRLSVEQRRSRVRPSVRLAVANPTTQSSWSEALSREVGNETEKYVELINFTTRQKRKCPLTRALWFTHSGAPRGAQENPSVM